MENIWADNTQFLVAFISAGFVVYNVSMMWKRFFYQTATARAEEGFARTKEEALSMSFKTDKNKEEKKDNSANGAGAGVSSDRDEELESMLRSFIEFYNASKEGNVDNVDSVDNVDNVDNSVDNSVNNTEDGAPISKAEKSVSVDDGDNGSTEHNKALDNDSDADNDDAPGDVADTDKQVVKTAENESVDENKDNKDNSVEDSGKNHNDSPAGGGARELEEAVVALSKKNLMLETALRGGISVEAAEALSGSTVEEKLAKLHLVREARPTRGTESLRETRVNALVRSALGA